MPFATGETSSVLVEPKVYSLCGLTFELPFEVAILQPAPPGASPDVSVRVGLVPGRLSDAVAAKDSWEASPGKFLVRGGMRSGRFLVEGGNVTFDPNPGAEPEIVAFQFLHLVLGAVLRQHGLLVLHANVAVADGQALAVSGVSGAGKSTTLAALLSRGCAMLADDVAVLRLKADSTIEVLPGLPQFHLTEEAAAALGTDISAFPQYDWHRKKAAIPAALATEPAPLRALYRLRTHSGSGLRVRTLSGAEKFVVLQECLYSPMLAGEHPGAFPIFQAILNQAAIFDLARPEGVWSIDAVVRTILAE